MWNGYIFDEKASVNGECFSTKFADSETFKEKHHFNLNFKKGWNLVEHEIQEVFKDKTGKIHPTKIQWKVVEEMPEDVQWTFIAETR